MNKKFTCMGFMLSLLAVGFAAPVSAQNYAVNVHGIVCELCSFGVAKNIRKLAFVNSDSEQYEGGVKVDITNQMVYVAARDGALLNRKALYSAIEAGGYKPVKIWEIDEAGEQLEYKE